MYLWFNKVDFAEVEFAARENFSLYNYLGAISSLHTDYGIEITRRPRNNVIKIYLLAF